jgi:hypothetical protein
MLSSLAKRRAYIMGQSRFTYEEHEDECARRDAAIAQERALAGILVASATAGISAEEAAMLANATQGTAPLEDHSLVELDYRIALQSGGNHLLTPLEIPDYEELSAGGGTRNKEAIDFQVSKRKDEAGNLLIEVLDGGQVIFSDPHTTNLLSGGTWQWDGYDTSGVLDTRVLKSPNLKVRLTASKGGTQQVRELALRNSAREVDWVDAKIDRNAKTVEVTVRPAFTDGGVKGSPTPGLTAIGYTPKTFVDLMVMAKQGIDHYWSRNGSRGSGVDTPIQTAQGAFSVTVQADMTGKPKAKSFKLVERVDESGGRATSLWIFAAIYHNAGAWNKYGWPTVYADKAFKNTAAHEFGHLILNGYGNDGFIPEYSWGHKNTSTIETQAPLPGTSIPASGEIDVMTYYDYEHSYPNTITHPLQLPGAWQEYWDRSVASEQDVKGLLWLCRIRFAN